MKVILYGAGFDCKKNLKIIPKEWEIMAIADKDVNKHGSIMPDTKIGIIPVEDIAKYEYDFIIIMSLRYKDEIRKELLESGISPINIIDGVRTRYNNNEEGDKAETSYLISETKERKLQKATKYTFVDRSRNSEKLLYVLIGYKKDLWDDVIGRLKRFVPNDFDICLASSGMFSWDIQEIAIENGWSYLGTQVNDVSMIQNIVIENFPKAKYIFKMDEDIFLTRNCCQNMLNIYQNVEKEGRYRVGVVGPIIPLHTTGYFFLDRFGYREEYEEKFGVLCAGGRWANEDYTRNSEIPKYLWSRENLDKLSMRIVANKGNYCFSPIKYAICFVLFSRDFYNLMNGFRVNRRVGSAGVSGDEGQMNNTIIQNCLTTVIALDSIVGHFSYPAQENDMLEFRKENPQFFDVYEYE